MHHCLSGEDKHRKMQAHPWVLGDPYLLAGQWGIEQGAHAWPYSRRVAVFLTWIAH